MLIVRLLLFLTLVGAAGSLHGAPHTRVDLLLDKTSTKPGETILAGVRLRMDPRWHTYWRNPGASGMATKIAWQLPPGVSAGAIQWPVPEKLPDTDLTTYVYHNETVLLVPLAVGESVRGEIIIKAAVSWLECETQCIPGKADVSASVTVSDESRPSPQSSLLQDWLKRLPESGDASKATAWWDGPATGDSRKLTIQWQSPTEIAAPDYYPDGSKTFEISGETSLLKSEPGNIRLGKTVQKLSAWPKELSGLLVGTANGQRSGFDVRLPINESEGHSAKSPIPSRTGPGLWQMLLYAFIGGLILNIMPCVLPVIALKILGFVNQAGDHPRRVRTMGFIYTLGVLVSFATLAALVIGVKAAGHRAGWGMQFGNPQFLVILTILMTVVALNLFGLFEITPSGKVMDKAGTLAAKDGYAGAFFNGVLATVLATPCTAPFLGAALGFAFAASAGVILLVFSTVALGLAAPYVLLSCNPRWLRFLPKPGVWMDRFKVAMGFPMLATAAWLLGLTQIHYGGKSFWLAIFLVILGMAAWVYGQFVQRATRPRPGLAVALLLLFSGYVFALENQMRWRFPKPPAAAGGVTLDKDGIPWEEWSSEAVASARAEGRPVLVDFTADWCLTCQANKKFALEIQSVRTRLREINAVALLGDYTRLPGEITDELQRFGRAGVPLVLVYPRDPAKPPVVLPEALTPGIVLGALDQAR